MCVLSRIGHRERDLLLSLFEIHSGMRLDSKKTRHQLPLSKLLHSRCIQGTAMNASAFISSSPLCFRTVDTYGDGHHHSLTETRQRRNATSFIGRSILTSPSRRRRPRVISTAPYSCSSQTPSTFDSVSDDDATPEQQQQSSVDVGSESEAIKTEQPNATTNVSATNETPPDVLPFGMGFRVTLTVLALAGAVETLYLTYNKMFSSPGAICGTQGCLDVLSGPFSNFLGFPLSLYGSMAYLCFAYLSYWPILSPDPADSASSSDSPSAPPQKSFEEVYTARDRATRPLMLGLSTAQFAFSLYLVGLLKYVIQSMCPYCLFSAGLSATLFILTAFIGRAVPNWRPAISISMASTIFAAILSSASFLYGYPIYTAAQPDSPQNAPVITTVSDQDALRIATKLKSKNSKMYGAFWCTHCYDQKQRFGKKAFSMLTYIECDKNGVDSQFQLCRDKRIPGYPTWEIDGELFPGEIEITELERLVDEASKP